MVSRSVVYLGENQRIRNIDCKDLLCSYRLMYKFQSNMYKIMCRVIYVIYIERKNPTYPRTRITILEELSKKFLGESHP